MNAKAILLTGILVAISTASVYAENGDRQVIVQSTTGNVEYQKSGDGSWVKTSKDAVLSESDVVRTGDDSTADLLFKGTSSTTIQLRPNSVLELSNVSEPKPGQDATELDLSLGSVLVKAEKLQGDSQFHVRTPNSIVGIRVTE